MNNRELAKLEKKVPERAVAALNAASSRAIASQVPQVVVIENGLYRVSASGKKELLRTLAPRMTTGRSKRRKA